jgi:hypothetical protein
MVQVSKEADGSKSARIATQPVRAGSSASVTLTYDNDDLSHARQ